VARVRDAVIWHDLECGAYDCDLPLWRDLAAQTRGPILDVGAGTGRVALDLARRGHEVTALDVDEELLQALVVRAKGVPIDTVCADARDFRLGRRFALILVPMQTIQLLSGEPQRASFLAAARAHLEPEGILALAIADALEGYDERESMPPAPDMRELAGFVYASTPMRIVDYGDRIAIERRREIVDAAGEREVTQDVVSLERLTAAQIEQEARACGFRVLPRRHVPPTDEYVGSEVVMLGA
jgi:SAM-dependent methyltransferase